MHYLVRCVPTADRNQHCNYSCSSFVFSSSLDASAVTVQWYCCYTPIIGNFLNTVLTNCELFSICLLVFQQVLTDLRMFEKADDNFKHAIELEPDNGNLYVHRGFVLFDGKITKCYQLYVIDWKHLMHLIPCTRFSVNYLPLLQN